MGMALACYVPGRRCLRRPRGRWRPESWHLLFSERRYLYCVRYRESTGFRVPTREWATLKWLGGIAPGVPVQTMRMNRGCESADGCQVGLTVGFARSCAG